MNVCKYIFSFLLCFFILSCINNRKPIYEDPSDVIHPGDENTKVEVFGYGYFKGKSKIAVQRFAIHLARVSIAEQAKGSVFSLERKKADIVFSTDTGDVNLSGVETVAEKIWQQAGPWEMYVIQSTKIEIPTPRGKIIVVKELSEEGTDIPILISSLQEKAVKQAVTGLKDLADQDKITGHIYLTSLEIEPDAEGPSVSIQVRFHIVFD